MAHMGDKPATGGSTARHYPVIAANKPSEIPTYAVVRETNTTARVVNTLTGLKTDPMPIPKACKRANQLNGDRDIND